MKDIVAAIVVIAAIGLVVILIAINFSSTPAEKSAQASAFTVDTLFTHDGVTVYRFTDQGRSIYFASRGETSWSEYHSTGRSGYTVGRNVMTVEECRKAHEKKETEE